MPPKKPDLKKGPPAAVLAKLKAQLEAQKKFEEEERLREEEEQRKFDEEIKLAEEQRKFEEVEKERLKELKKEEQKDKKQDAKKIQQYEALIRMKMSGMQIPMTKELEEFEKEYLEKQKNKSQAKQEQTTELKQEQEQQEETQENNLRAPICCVLGHVDVGKTSLLDKLRSTNVQEGEAGGITQQIGATFFPKDYLLNMTKDIKDIKNMQIQIPGILVIDTPGHEQFSNLRNRGSSICDVAIVVIDMMHGLENQTRESLKLLRQKKCPFLIALNKVDRLYDWIENKNMDIQQSLSLQKKYVLNEFETRIHNIKLQLSEEGFNSELYYKNTDIKKQVSLVPVSAKSGEGLSDLILWKIKLVQQFMENKISYRDDIQCTILEVKPLQGLGMTMDVILVNGTLKVGNKIVLCGANGAIVTQIRSLLTPQPMKELRVKSSYIHHQSIKASQCIKITADGLDDVIAGTTVYVINKDKDKEREEEELAKYKKEVEKEMKSFNKSISKDKVGVSVQSSTLGSLEALLTYLEQINIPIGSISLGPIHKKHIMHTITMKQKAPKYACMLAFDVELTPDAKILAEKEGIKVFNANIIYHLCDSFVKYTKEYEQNLREKNKYIAIFPTVLQVLCCFRAKDPLVIGCRVLEGQVRAGTPLIVRDKDKNNISIGKILGLQINNKDVQIGEKGHELAIKLDGKTTIFETKVDENGKEIKVPREQLVNYGRQFGENSILASAISRKSIDALKESFRDEMDNDDWKLIIELKKEQNIV
jgi:translation initiation factor 5B